MVFDAALAATLADGAAAKAPVHDDASLGASGHDVAHNAVVEALTEAAPVANAMDVSVLSVPIDAASKATDTVIVCRATSPNTGDVSGNTATTLPPKDPIIDRVVEPARPVADLVNTATTLPPKDSIIDCVVEPARPVADLVNTATTLPPKDPITDRVVDPVRPDTTEAGTAVLDKPAIATGPSTLFTPDAVAATAQNENIVFVDSAVANAQAIVDHVAAGAHVVYLDASSNGLDQIAAYLSTHHDVASIHILSHGASGELTLGNTILTSDNLDAQRAALETIGHALRPGGDILIYGCNVASGEAGGRFIQQIAALTGDDVAASTDVTGAARLGGNWELEAHVGDVRTLSISAPGWDDTLTVTVTTNTNPTTLTQVISPAGGSGITIIGTPTITTSGNTTFAGTFNTTGSNLGLTTGIILGTGNVSQVPGVPGTFWNGAGTGVSNAAASEFDVAALTFSFTPNAGVNRIVFQSVFGSEEYNQYVNTAFTDNYSVVVNGGTYANQNVATVPGTALGIDINTINNGLNATYYRDNTVATPPVGDVVLGGLTTVINNGLSVVPGTTYTITIRIADVGDNGYNSAVFVGAFAAALQIDLDANNSAGRTGADYQTSFTEGGSAVSIVDVDRTITNYDTANVQRATVTLTNPQAGDQFTIGTLPTGITAATTTNGLGQTVITLTGSATTASYQTALDAITFSNSASLTSATVRDIAVVLNNGNTDSNTAHSYITVAPVDNAPVITPASTTQTVNEDTALVFNTANGNAITFSDVDAGSTGLETVTLAVANGTLNLGSTTGLTGLSGNGTGTVTLTGTVAQVNAAVAGLTYRGVLNYNGADTLTIATVDDGRDNGVLASNGAQSAVIKTVAINVTPVNDAPVANSDAGTTLEDTPITITAATLLANDTDVDTGDTRTLVSVQSPVNGTVTLNASGYPVFTPNANFNGTASYTYTMRDAAGLTSTATVTITVTPVNDAPAGADRTSTVNEDTPYTFAASDFGFTDPNDSPANTLQSVVITTLPSAADGVLRLSGVAVTAGQELTAAQIASLTFTPALNRTGNGIGGFTFQVRDNGGTANGGVDLDASPNAFTFNVTPVNDAPVATAGAPLTFTEQGSPVLLATTLSDVDNTTLSSATITLVNPQTGDALGLPTLPSGSGITVTSYNPATGVLVLSGTSSIANYQSAINSIGFFNTIDNPSVVDRTITVAVNDGQLTSAAASTIVHVTPINDAPVVLLNPQANLLTNGSFETAIAGVVTNGNNNVGTSWSGWTLTNGTFLNIIQPGSTPYAQGPDSAADGQQYLDISGNGIVQQAFSVTTAGVYNFSGQFANRDTFGNPTPVSGISGVIEIVDANGVVVASSGNLTVARTAGDEAWFNANGSATLAPGTYSYRVTLGNFFHFDNAIVSANTNSVATFVENGAPVSIANALGNSLTDPDNANLQSMTVVLTNRQPGDVLALGSLPGGIQSNLDTSDPTRITLTLTGDASLANYQTALSGVTYANSLDSPSATDRTITVVVNDGAANSNTAVSTITVSPVNDAPVITAPTQATTTEDSTVVFSAANGNAITFADIDSGAAGQETVTLAVARGTLNLATTSGLTGLTGNGTGSITFTGTIAQINAAVAGLTYTNTLDYNGSDNLTITLADDGLDNGNGTTNGILSATPKVIPITITPVVDITSDAIFLLEDTPTTFNVLTGTGGATADSFENPAAAVTAITQPTHGTVTFAANGQMTYTPTGNYNGPDSFTYTVTSGGVTETATVTLTVTAVNDAPVSSVPGAQTVNEDSALVFSGANAITIADVDAAGTGLETVTLSVAHGTLNLGSFPVGLTYTNDGTSTLTLTGTLAQVNAAIAGLTYRGTANYNGPDLLTIQVRDDGTDNGLAASNGALSGVVKTVAITVTPVNDAPVANDDVYTTLEDTPITVFPLSNDTDIDGNSLQITEISGYGADATSVLTLPSGSTVTVNPNGSLTYVPGPNVTGSETITYSASDGNGGEATASVTFNITPVNDAPVAVNDSYTTGEHTTLTVPLGTGLLANDSDVDNANTALIVTQVNGNAISSGAPIVLPSGAILTQNADGSFAYNPNNVFNSLTTGQSATDTFTYQVSDGAGGFATATATVRIDGINDPPVAAADNGSTSPLVVLTANAAYGVLANDTDIDTAHNLLAVAAVNGIAGNVDTPVPGTNGGLFTIHPDGSYAFDPNGQFNGIVGTTSVSYTVTDGTNTSTTTLTVSVPYTNLPPFVANPLPAQSSQDGETIAIDLSNVFSDYNPGDQGHLTIAASGLPPGLTLVSATDPATGVVTYSVTGTLLSDDSVHAGPYVVTLTASDAGGSTASTTFNFSVGNPAPVAANDVNTALEHGTTNGTVLTNDVDGGNDSDALSVTLVNGQPYTAGSVITLASGAQLVMGADGTYSYDTNNAFNGLALGATATDSFTYQVGDGQGGYATATATITITGQNDAPIVVNPANPGTPPADPNHIVPNLTGQDGTAINPVNVSSYFRDPDTGDTLTLSTTGTLPTGVTFDPATGTFSGTPSATASQGGPGNNGVYSVLVTATDGHGGVVSTIVTFTITNPAPVAGNDSNTVLEHGITTGNVATNDHDGGGDTDPLSVATVNGQSVNSGGTITLPSGALLVMNANGTYSYDPNGSFASLTAAQTATDSFTYTISDGQGGTSQATVTIQIQGQNDNPVALADMTTTAPQAPVSADAAHGVLANDSDVENDPLTVTSVTNGTTTVAAGGTIAGTGGGTFTINADGSYTFNPGTAFNNLAVGASAQSSVTYTISDGHGGTSSTTLTVTVPYQNLPPVVQAPIPTQNTLDGNTVSIPVGGVFADPNTIDTLTITATGLPSGLTYNPATGAIEGTVASDASQHGGVPYTVTLTANDGHGGTTTSTFVMNVGNPAPVAANDVNTVTEHGTITGAASVLGNDVDGLNDHDPLSVSQINGQAYTPGGSITLASGALLVMNADGTYSYDPHSAFNGLAVGQTAIDTFTYRVSDGQGGVATATVTITVTGQNEAPVVINPATPGTPPIDPNHVVPAQTGQDGSAVAPLDVRGLFRDADTADTLTYAVNPASLPAGITFANGVFSGTPTASASQTGNVNPGVYDIVVTASDGHGGTVATTVRYTITNPAPVAANDSNSVAEHGTITGAASVLGNDRDGGSDTDPLAVTQVNGTAITSGSTIVLPSGAHLIMNTNGTYSYDPNGAFLTLQVGQATTDTFTYQVSDGQGGFATATVTIVINGQNDAPVASNDAGVVTGAAASISVAAPLGVLANDTDPENGVLTVTAVTVGATTLPAGTAITGSNGGQFIVNADGSYSFDPGTDFLNLLPGQIAQSSVTYTVTDDQGATATATLTITVPYENLPPVLNQVIPAQSSFDGNPVSIDVTNVFRDPNNDALTITVGNLPPGLIYDPISHVISGTLTSAASNHTGPYVVTLTADDGRGGTLVTTFNFAVNNQPPVAANDTNTVTEHGTLMGQTVVGNDRDGGLDQDALSVAQVNGAPYTPGTPIALASGAVITMLANGTYSYDTNTAFNGLAAGETASDSFTYTITDSQGATSTATVAITITGQNDTPVIVDPAHPGQPVAPGTQVLPTTEGLDGSPISPLTVTGLFADPDHGDTVTLSVDPTTLPPGVTFNPVTGTFSGTLGANDSIGGPSGNGTYPVTVTGTDASGATVTTTVVFHVGNPAPIAVTDSIAVSEDGTVPGNVLTNDRDGGSDTDPLSVTQVNGQPLVPGAAITLPSGAQLVMAADGSYTYDPNGVFNGLGQGETATDSFTYQVSDGQGGFATATATVTIQGQNDAPTTTGSVPSQPAQDGTAITPVTITGIFTDIDHGDTLTLSVLAGTLPPGIVFDPVSGTFSGTPTANASQGGPGGNGTYPITVTATDSAGATVTTVVTFVIANPPPVAVNDTTSVAEHGTVTANVLTNDPDGGSDTDPLVVSQVNGATYTPGTSLTLPSGALLTMAADGTYTYDPNGVFNGLAQGETATQTFTYQVSDNNGGLATATVTLTITGVNDAPIVVDPAHPGTPPADPMHIVPSQSAQDGSAITPLDVTGYFADPDHGDTFALSVPAGSLPPGVTFVNGVFSGTPTSDASHGGPANNGIYPITVTATDRLGATVTTIVTFAVANPAPVAVADTLTTPADAIGTGIILYNDHDGGADQDTLTVTQVNGATYTPATPITLGSGALLTMNADGTYSYNPNGIADGIAHGTTVSDSFTYQVSDGQGGFDTATVTITINAVNAAPVVVDPAHPGTPPTDPLHVVPAQPGSDGSPITTISVATYFADPDAGDMLTYAVPTGSLPNGIVFDPATGTFSGTPTTDASQGGPSGNGTYPIVVTASDGYGGTTSTIVTFQIGNVAPVATDDTLSVPVHGGTLLGGTVLTNDTDGGGDTDPLHVSQVNGTTFTPGTAITLPSGALLTMNLDGSYTYDPNGTHPGLGFGETATDSFTYQVSDGNGGFATATVDITITGVNDAPVVVDPAHPGTPPTDPLHVVPTLGGSDGAAITPLTVTSYFTDPNTNDTLTLSVDPTTLPVGVTFDPATGTFSGTPAADASTGGPAGNGTYPVVVTADDGHGGTVTTIVVFQIGNQAPVATADTGSAPEHGTTTGNVLTNDHDGGGDTDPLSVTQVNGQPLVPGATITLASGATLVMGADGSYTYDPNGVFTSLAVGETATDTFTYQVSDGHGGFDTATATITITGQNDAPVVVDPAHPGQPPADPMHVIPVQTASDGAPITPVTVTSVFTDPDATDLLTLSVPLTSLPPGIVFDPATGTFSGTPDATASQGGPGGNGTYPVVITASDGHGGTVSTVIVFQIANPPPVAVNDTAVASEHTGTTGSVLTNDHDGGSDTDPLVVSQVNGQPLVPGGTITLPSGALLVMDAFGNYSYNPNGVFQALSVGEIGSDTFTYQMSDGQGGFATATVTISVTGVNDAPIVVDPVTGQPSTHPDTVIPAVSGSDGTTITPVTVGNVFYDPDAHDTLTLTVDPATLPPGITFDPATGTFTGTPSSDASNGGPNGDGVYPIIVTANDGHGGTVTTTVTFTFTNPPPVATNDLASGQPDQVLTLNVLGNDHDGGNDHDTLTVVSATTTAGTVVINPNGTLDFTPDSGFVGVATITYTISDGQGGTSTATATVLITPNIPVVGPPPPTLPGTTELLPGNTGLIAIGAVLDAVHAADDLGTTPTTGLPTGIAATGIVDLAANQISHLGGLANRIGLGGTANPFGQTDPRLTSPVWQLQNLISQRLGGPSDQWAPEGLTGFSLRYTFAADPTSNARAQIVLDSIVRDRTLIVNLSSTQIADHAHVVEYRVMQADGRPLPGWLDRAGSNVLMGERPVDVEEIKLHVIAVMSDGTTIERDVVIQTNSGEIQPLKDTKRTDVMPLFTDQLRQFAERDETEFERLLTALAG